jgi:DNA repair exonuclease SbcCD nuclease subunit
MKLNKINIDKPIIVVGDVHGYYNTVVSFIKNNNISNFILLFAGDTGCGFSSKNSLQVQLQKLDKICVKNNINVLMLRGNHDDPSYFNTDEPFEFGNIKCIPDYTLINNEVLCIGGATSIDRSFRKRSYEHNKEKYLKYHHDASKLDENVFKSYWENEQPIYDDEAMTQLKNENILVKHIVSHTCPKFCIPYTKDGIINWLSHDLTLSKDCDNERNIMTQIYDNIDKSNLKTWTYGHFHFHDEMWVDNVKFTVLSGILRVNDYVDTLELK